MQSPRLPDVNVLGKLTGEMKVYLMQFILHKRLTVEKLRHIVLENEDKIKYILQYLKRAGLIYEQAEQVYEIDSYMHIHLAKYLFDDYDKAD